MRYCIERKVINKLKRYEFVIVYGAGGVGQRVASWLLNHHISNFCFAVTDLKQNPNTVGAIEVKQIDDLVGTDRKQIVFVATMPDLHKEIGQKLDGLGLQDKIFVSDRLLKSMGIVDVNGVFPVRRSFYYAKLNQITRKLFRLLKLKNMIIFESKIDYTDNCRALSEYIDEHMHGKYEIVWIVKEAKKLKSDRNYTYINRCELSTKNLVKLNYCVARAKFIFFTHPGWLCEWKPEQKVINLGHGNPFKKAEQHKGKVADCVLASGEDGIAYRKLEYEEEIEVEVLGPPRNDWLFGKGIDEILIYTRGKRYRKNIICLPTYKQYDIVAGSLKKTKYDSKETNAYCFNTIENIEQLEQLNLFLAEQDVLFICKDHYLQRASGKTSLSNIIYIDDAALQRNGHDIYQLFPHMDALVTDFSSVFMDFLLLDKPIAFFCNSAEQYTRGIALAQPERYMAGMKIYNTEDLKSFILSVAEEKDDYGEARESARNLIFRYQDNQNCRRCAEYFQL